MGVVKDLVSKDTLTIAGGAVLSTMASTYVLQKWGPTSTGFKLPGSDQPYGLMAYSVAIPVAASVLAHRFSPALSKGLMIGGAGMLINSIITLMTAPRITNGNGGTNGTSAYLRRGTIRALPGSPPGYSAVRAFGGALDNSNAFKGAWSR